MTRAKSIEIRYRSKQTVLVEEPSVKSPSSLVLLNREYFFLDKSIYSTSRMMQVRAMWMRKQMKTPDRKGGLTCAICGKQGLKPEGVKNKKKIATLDHIVNISDGGAWNDETNFQVACHRCNNLKEKMQLVNHK